MRILHSYRATLRGLLSRLEAAEHGLQALHEALGDDHRETLDAVFSVERALRHTRLAQRELKDAEPFLPLWDGEHGLPFADVEPGDGEALE